MYNFDKGALSARQFMPQLQHSFMSTNAHQLTEAIVNVLVSLRESLHEERAKSRERANLEAFRQYRVPTFDVNYAVLDDVAAEIDSKYRLMSTGLTEVFVAALEAIIEETTEPLKRVYQNYMKNGQDLAGLFEDAQRKVHVCLVELQEYGDELSRFRAGFSDDVAESDEASDLVRSIATIEQDADAIQSLVKDMDKYLEELSLELVSVERLSAKVTGDEEFAPSFVFDADGQPVECPCGIRHEDIGFFPLSPNGATYLVDQCENRVPKIFESEVTVVSAIPADASWLCPSSTHFIKGSAVTEAFGDGEVEGVQRHSDGSVSIESNESREVNLRYPHLVNILRDPGEAFDALDESLFSSAEIQAIESELLAA